MSGLPTPLVVLCEGIIFAFAPGTSEMAVGSWSFCILLFIICCNCTCRHLFLGPYDLFSVDPGEVYPDASTVVKGPKSQVPACLKRTGKASKEFTQNSQITNVPGLNSSA